MKIKKIFVTPKKASLLLKANASNQRNITQRRVATYAVEMLTGKWVEDSGETIKFTSLGVMVDGQTRISAILAAHHKNPDFKGVSMYAAFGVPQKAIFAIDQGRARSIADIAKIGGISANKNNLAVFRAMRMAYIDGTLRGKARLRIAEEELEEYIKHEDAVRFATKVLSSAEKGACRNSIVAAVVGRAYLARPSDRARIEEFAEILKTGIANGEKDSAVIKLRSEVFSMKRGKLTTNFGQKEWDYLYGITLSALDAFLNYRSIKRLVKTNRQLFSVASLDGVDGKGNLLVS